MPNEQVILQRIQQVYNEVMCTEDVILSLDTKLDEKMGISSFALVEMAYAIEEAFGITISNSALRSFKRIRDVIAYIEKALQNSAE